MHRQLIITCLYFSLHSLSPPSPLSLLNRYHFPCSITSYTSSYPITVNPISTPNNSKQPYEISIIHLQLVVVITITITLSPLSASLLPFSSTPLPPSYTPESRSASHLISSHLITLTHHSDISHLLNFAMPLTTYSSLFHPSLMNKTHTLMSLHFVSLHFIQAKENQSSFYLTPYKYLYMGPCRFR